MLASAISDLPHSTWLLVVFAAALGAFFVAYKIGSVVGFIVKNVVALVALGVAVFFLAPVFLGQARGQAFQDRVRQALHLSQVTACAKAADRVGVSQSASRLGDCAKAEVKKGR